MRARLTRLAADVWRESGRSGQIQVEGRSMVPTFPEGARIWFRPLGEDPVRRGDILVYAERPGFVVHRVLRRLSCGGYRTKGDGRALVDSRAIERSAVLGRVCAVERREKVISLDGRGARSYAAGIALLSAALGLVGQLAWLADRIVRRLAGGTDERRPIGRLVAWLGRGLMRVVDGVFFAALHSRTTPPTDDAAPTIAG